MASSSVCRLCGGAKNDVDIVSNINDIEEENLTLRSFVQYYCRIELQADKNLPQKVCRVCRLVLETFIAFTGNLSRFENSLTADKSLTKVEVRTKDENEQLEGNKQPKTESSDMKNRDPVHYCFKSYTKDKTAIENVEKLFAEGLKQSIFDLEDFTHITVDKKFVSEVGEISRKWLENFGISTWKDFSYDCLHCQKKFKSLRSMMNHLLEPDAKKAKIKCNHCDRQFSAMNSYMNHIASSHSCEHLPFCCVRCGKIFYNIATLIKHYKRDHPKTAEVFPCIECGYYALNITALKAHVLCHTIQELSDESDGFADDDVNMPGTSQSFSNPKRSERLNRRSDYRGDPSKPKRQRTQTFPCTQCDKIYLTKSGLIYHTLVHSDSKPYMCKYCKISFRAQQACNNHSKICAIKMKAIQ